jgi:hypothetical protein
MRTLAFRAKSFSNDVVAAWPRAPTSSLLKLIDSTSPVLGLRLCFGTSMSHGFPLAPLKLARCPHSLAPPLVALPSMSLIPSAPLMRSLPRDLSVTLTDLTVHLARSHGSVHALLPFAVRQLPDRSSHSLSRRGDLDRPSRSFPRLDCISAAPAALDRYLAALPAMSLIPSAPLKLARCPHLRAASLAALPSMSLLPRSPLSKTSRPPCPS